MDHRRANKQTDRLWVLNLSSLVLRPITQNHYKWIVYIIGNLWILNLFTRILYQTFKIQSMGSTKCASLSPDCQVKISQVRPSYLTLPKPLPSLGTVDLL